MGRSPRVDAYIRKAPEFARPILETIRKAFHKADPGMEETIKWGAPHFERDGIVGGMAAFKKHVTWGLFHGKKLEDPDGLFEGVGKSQMCAMRIEEPSDLPKQTVIVRSVREAVRFNKANAKDSAKKKASGGKTARAGRVVAKRKVPPKDLTAALKKNRKALATFERFSNTNRNEYVEWVTGAKQEATRARRIATAVEWMAEGKPRNWKYTKKW